MPLADDTSGTSTTAGEGFAPLFSDASAGSIVLAPNPNPGPVGLRIFDDTDWKDNNLGDNPRRIFSPRPGSTGGVIFPDSSQWFVDEWWIFPRPVDFGIIVSDKTVTVSVLNAFRNQNLTLDAVDLSAFSDVSNTANPPPFGIRFLEQVDLDFTAAEDGVPTFSDDAVFEFSNRNVLVQMEGIRVILFPYPPEAPLTEQLSWLTDIMKSRDQTEQRHSMRVRPRQTVDMEILPDNEITAATIRNILFNRQTVPLGIPEWWDMRIINSTTPLPAGTTVIPCDPDDAMFFADRNVVMVFPDGSFTDGEIDSVQAGTSVTLKQPTIVEIPTRSFIIPFSAAILTRPPTYNDFLVNQQASRIQVELNSTEDIAFSEAEFDASAFEKHPVDGLLVLSDRNLVSGPRFRHSARQDSTREDSGIGQVHRAAKDAIAIPNRPKGAKLNDVATIWQWKKLLHYLRGSWKAFYLPTFQNDLPINTTINLGSTTVIIAAVNAADVGFETPHRDVFIEVLTDGRTYVRRVTNIVDNGDGTETISLSTAPEGAPEVLNGDDVRISWAEFVRIDGDAATFIYDYVGQAIVRFNTQGVKE